VCYRGNSGVSGVGECEREKMTARCRCGNEEIENRNWREGEERRCTMCCEDNEREGGKGAGSNTEQRRKEDRMDERDMEEERKNIEGKEWGIEKKMLFSL
jgi:hypothetical protein